MFGGRFLIRHRFRRKVYATITVLVVVFLLKEKNEIVGFFVRDCPTRGSIDVVYTWVNGSDPAFLQSLRDYLGGSKPDFSQRFDDKNELKFSLRSLEKYASWVRHVFIVTNGQIPHWLNLDYDKVTLVGHDEIFEDLNDLPTFSSPAIESHLHRIPGLSNRFIYLNDDVFFGAPVHEDDFVSSSRGFLIYLAYSLPNCSPDCSWIYVADGQCDEVCLNDECQMDGGDCNEEKALNRETSTDRLNYSVQNKIKALHHNETHIFVQRHNREVMKIDKVNRKKLVSINSTLIKKIRDGNLHVDAYGASLQHTNRLFNEKYKFTPRYVPAHGPILIDRDIVQELHRNFNNEFRKTSKNRLRSPDDIQFAFSYYYYLIHEKRLKSVAEIFDGFDTDSSGTWSDREIRTILTKLYELPLSYSIVDHFESILQNCTYSSNDNDNNILQTTPEYERYIDSTLPTITKSLVSNCAILGEILTEHFGYVNKYKYEIIKNSHSKQVAFKMINSNISDVVGQLDEIRRKTRKFVCLNDNLDDAKPAENELIKSILYDFYLSLFPKMSKFELPVEYRNRFQHLDELRSWKSYRFRINLCVYLMLFILIQIILASFCKRRLFGVFLCALSSHFRRNFR